MKFVIAIFCEFIFFEGTISRHFDLLVIRISSTAWSSCDDGFDHWRVMFDVYFLDTFLIVLSSNGMAKMMFYMWERWSVVDCYDGKLCQLFVCLFMFWGYQRLSVKTYFLVMSTGVIWPSTGSMSLCKNHQCANPSHRSVVKPYYEAVRVLLNPISGANICLILHHKIDETSRSCVVPKCYKPPTVSESTWLVYEGSSPNRWRWSLLLWSIYVKLYLHHKAYNVKLLSVCATQGELWDNNAVLYRSYKQRENWMRFLGM